MQTGLVVETGEAREVHHFCVLAGYGAEAINPWLAFDTIDDLCAREGRDAPDEAQANYIKAIGKGILKVMSKMGISTFQSYCGAQIFDAIGLGPELVDEYFTGTATVIEGIGLAELAEETARRHRAAHAPDADALDLGGLYAQRIGGEAHAWTFDSIANLQHAVRGNLPDKYRAFAEELNARDRRLLTLRGLLDFKPAGPAGADRRGRAGGGDREALRDRRDELRLDQPRGACDAGGGDEPDRRQIQHRRGRRGSATASPPTSARRSSRSPRAASASPPNIWSMPTISRSRSPRAPSRARAASCPGTRSTPQIAAVRHSTPGVGLISPPPHHDIYSIEDLAQLIHDLRSVNPAARISVKLVSEVGVGTVAAGVAKCLADHITIAGYEGGTGASPLTSLTHAGLPWEIGLAETQQTLVLNGLRERVCVQADGGLRTGRDVAIAALLGADEYGFATAPLIAAGCIMMRKCHLNTCPVGIATQDPVLRARFTGTPEHVINYFFFVAEELREIMAGLGLRIARRDDRPRRPARSRAGADGHWKARGVDLSRLLHLPRRRRLRRHDAPICRASGDARSTGR